MSAGSFASPYAPREYRTAPQPRNLEPAAEKEAPKELRTLLLTKRGAAKTFASGGAVLLAMLLVLLGGHPFLTLLGGLFLIIPTSTVGVMLALWGMLAWCVNVMRAEMAEARIERGMILENQARLIAQNEHMIGERSLNGKYDTADITEVARRVTADLGRTVAQAAGRTAVATLPPQDIARIVASAAPAKAGPGGAFGQADGEASVGSEKYLADMAESVRLGRELERRRDQPPEVNQ